MPTFTVGQLRQYRDSHVNSELKNHKSFVPSFEKRYQEIIEVMSRESGLRFVMTDDPDEFVLGEEAAEKFVNLMVWVFHIQAIRSGIGRFPHTT